MSMGADEEYEAIKSRWKQADSRLPDHVWSRMYLREYPVADLMDSWRDMERLFEMIEGREDV